MEFTSKGFSKIDSSSHMQEKLDAGNKFEIKMLCPSDKKHDRKTEVLEIFFILQYDGVKERHNTTYNYPFIKRTHEIVVRFITMWNVWKMRIYSKRTRFSKIFWH